MTPSSKPSKLFGTALGSIPEHKALSEREGPRIVAPRPRRLPAGQGMVIVPRVAREEHDTVLPLTKLEQIPAPEFLKQLETNEDRVIAFMQYADCSEEKARTALAAAGYLKSEGKTDKGT